MRRWNSDRGKCYVNRSVSRLAYCIDRRRSFFFVCMCCVLVLVGYVHFDYEGDESKCYYFVFDFFLRLFTVKNKADNGHGNVYFNDAYCTRFGEQAIETKGGHKVFSSGNIYNVSDTNVSRLTSSKEQ